MLIPCYNEEKSIKECIKSCLYQSRTPDEIIVVDDSSSDSTPEILRSFGSKIKVVRTPYQTGNKSYAQEFGFKYVTGDVFVTVDADSLLSKHFIKAVEDKLQDPKIAAVAGYVRSLEHNWLTACREIDYLIAQTIHKTAQADMGVLFILPGCGSAFRTDVFKKYIGFDHDTITEDMDYTYKLNTNRLKVAYDKRAVVYTQDPPNIRSYWRQMSRWYSGGWQNIMKHSKNIKDLRIALDLSLVYVESLIFSILLFVLPVINISLLPLILLPQAICLAIFAVYGVFKLKRIDLLIYSPFYFFIVFLGSAVFVIEFFKEVIFKKRSLVWLQADRCDFTCSH